MSRIVFTMIEELGHILPTFKLARSLRAKGHTVVYMQPPDFEAFIREQGFEWTPFLEHIYPKGFVAEFQARPRLERLRVRLGHQAAEMEAFIGGSMEKRLRKLSPDLMLVDYANGAMALLARKLGIPCAVLCTTFPAYRRDGVPPLSTALIPDGAIRSRFVSALAWERLLVWRRLTARTVPFLNRFGLTLDPRPDWPDFMVELAKATGYPVERLDLETTFPAPSFLDLPEWVLAPEMLDFPRRGNAHRIFVETVDEERIEVRPFSWERIDPQKKTIYCCMGSQAYRYRGAISQFRAIAAGLGERRDIQLVLAVGQKLRAELGELPSNTLVVDHAPQLELLRRAHLAIIHGGLGSVKECLFHGVPMLVVPQDFDQYGNAARVEYHGVGRFLDRDELSPRRVRDMVAEMERSEEMHQKVRVLREKFRESERLGRGVGETERMLKAREAHDKSACA